MKLLPTLSTLALATLALAAAPAAEAQVQDTARMRMMQDTAHMRMMQQDTAHMRMMQDTAHMRMMQQGQMQDTAQMRMQQMQGQPMQQGRPMQQGQQMQQGQMQGRTGAGMQATGAQNIVATAQEAGNFTTLVQAVQAANLAATLQGAGPYTVFAPTDAAFDRLPGGTVQNLMDNQAQLRNVLTYHVVRGRLTAADLRGRTSVTTLQGQTLPVMVHGDGVMVGNAMVQTADIRASNGIIHAVDGVLMPGQRVRKLAAPAQARCNGRGGTPRPFLFPPTVEPP
jgi:uncharacterized surface protein with fasciclin (FAS1) repeats